MSNIEQKITKVVAREIKDSRGKPTIEVEIFAGDVSGKAAVPSGKSTGSGEALELRDKDGGVSGAIRNVEEVIGPKIVSQEASGEAIDTILLSLDPTPDKSELGANATLGVSMAAMRLEAKLLGKPLWKLISERTGFSPARPLLYMNTLNGGAHADFCMPFQEYICAVGGEMLSEAEGKAKAIFSRVKEKLDLEKREYHYGDEGGFSTVFQTVEEPFALLAECVGDDKNVFFAIDAAASEFYREGKYRVLGKEMNGEELLGLYQSLSEKFDLKSIEDPFAEKDFEHFKKMTANFCGKILIVGDDLTTTNPEMIQKAGEERLANAVIVKPNQIGTMKETFEAISTARKYGWKIIVSHRSGETLDSFIADLAVGVGAYGIKAGAPNPPERAAKYERLLEIERELGTVV